ncbi:restriction endonuclease [Helicobacter sp. NHP19-003]|uniref:site-specific DNA-methyltransferase (adenine-specific) n=1 Tax=Helicobacter gastrocanis TaxID=2849641 RepID=A0ABM7SHK9_9HELI|nr:N-6 DNA methylase [Helicobacter sp. NHP19-003]BCZ17213.1 restriction endonuclease [Helicobacter sp. NHP19-003]
MQEALKQIQALSPKLEQAIKSDNEHQLEDNFISQVLEILGWQFLRQEEKAFQGKSLKPDFLLFASPNELESYQALDKDQRRENLGFSAILESKKPSQELDTRKVQDNPHHQILNYLDTLDHKYGFLTNGRLWRFYDTNRRTSHKAYLEFDLEGILNPQLFSQQALQAFELFYHLFNANKFATRTQEIKDTEENAINAKREDLERVIFARTDARPIFEQIGVALHAKNQEAPLDLIYENTLYFIFRLLFIGYFEDKYGTLLKAKRKDFKKYLSLERILQLSADQDPTSYGGMGELETLFKIYDKGNANYKMPVFNGGLFDSSKTALFDTGQILSDKELHQILAQLLYFGDEKRNYTNLGVAQLGRVYEKLLEFKFAIATQDTYLSTEQNATFTPTKPTKGNFTTYKKGALYFKNNNNSRKASGSYYTPQDITRHLVKKALKDLNAQNLESFKVLDNACGSGAFLVEALNQASKMAREFTFTPTFKKAFDAERAKIKAIAKTYLEGYEPDDDDILKRLLLKKMIYGVDKNPFSVELAKLSLWIDSFIFGTPLSFLEHHIKCGDALMGCSVKEFLAWAQKGGANLFNSSFRQELETLQADLGKLADIKDTDQDEIQESKALYAQIKPNLDKLNLYLNFYTATQLVKARNDPQELKFWKENAEGLEGINLELLLPPQERTDPKLKQDPDTYAKLRQKVQTLATEFRFFNYDLEFADALQAQTLFASGFHAIITNPPWEKTKFDEAQFFAPLIDNYRRLSPQEKRLAQENAKAKDTSLQAQLEKEQAHAKTLSEHYKARYPLNKGAGDSNLFRFFVERDLGLFSGRLCLVVPAALMLEEGSLALREHLLTHHSLESFESFENRQKIFKEVDSRFKFALLCLKATPPSPKHQINARFYCTHLKELEHPALEIPQQSVLNSPKKSIKEIHTQEDLTILGHLEAGFARLEAGWLDFRRELDMTNDNDLFTPIGEKWFTHAHTGLPYKDEPKKARGAKATPPQTPTDQLETFLLLEGKHIHQFNANFANPRYEVLKSALETRLESKEQARAKKAGYTGETTHEHRYFRLGYRGIARDTDERSLIVSLLPAHCTAGNSIYVSVPYRYTSEGIQETPLLQTLFALGVLNSLVIDYYLRHLTQININKFYMLQLPMPQPTTQEILTTPNYLQVAKLALECQLFHDHQAHFTPLLSATTDPKGGDRGRNAERLKPPHNKKNTFSSFSIENGIFEGLHALAPLEIPKTPAQLTQKRAELDILIATKIYRLTPEQFRHIISTFSVLAKKNGEFVRALEEALKP